MSRIATLLSALLLGATAFAQTPEEILSRMEAVMQPSDTEGVVTSMDIKLPLLGTMESRIWSRGSKMRMETETMGVKAIAYSDGVTTWTYTGNDNELEITNFKADSQEADTELFKGVAEGYDVSVKKETAEAWHLLCRKSRTNTNKDDPKTMDIVVAKGSYMPVSLSARMSGVSMTMHHISIGVSEEEVTFDFAKFPGAKVVDKR